MLNFRLTDLDPITAYDEAFETFVDDPTPTNRAALEAACDRARAVRGALLAGDRRPLCEHCEAGRPVATPDGRWLRQGQMA